MNDRGWIFWAWVGCTLLCVNIVSDATGGNSLETWAVTLAFVGLGVVSYRVEKSISVAEAEYDSALRTSYEEKIEALQNELDKKIEALKRFQARQTASS